MFLIDTCVISEFARKSPNRSLVDFVMALPESDLFLSVVTVGEITKGIHALPLGQQKRKDELSDWLNALLQNYSNRIFEIDTPTAKCWGEITGFAQRSGRALSACDGFIAATCIVHSLSLITANVKDFYDLGVQLAWLPSD